MIRKMISWRRVCGLSLPAGCKYFVPGIPESTGLTRNGYCKNTLNFLCEKRLEIEMDDLGCLAKRPVVAGYRHQRLLQLTRYRLYNVMPTILDREFGLLMTWVRDYTTRGIPWAVTRNGLVFTLWVERRV